MTVKQFWKKALGEFRTEDRISIELLRGKRVVVDTSAWVHQFDGKHDIQYARTSIPPYPHPGIINVFAARYAALVALGITPIFVFDGQSPTVKKRMYNNESSEEDWSPERFIKVRNLIKHYPIFEKDILMGDVSLQPLNPLPSDVPYDEWGSYIGFDNHPSTYFTDDNYTDYYNMTIIASTNKPRSQHLGPKVHCQ